MIDKHLPISLICIGLSACMPNRGGDNYPDETFSIQIEARRNIELLPNTVVVELYNPNKSEICVEEIYFASEYLQSELIQNGKSVPYNSISDPDWGNFRGINFKMPIHIIPSKKKRKIFYDLSNYQLKEGEFTLDFNVAYFECKVAFDGKKFEIRTFHFSKEFTFLK
jgi:hypothetical protein